MEYRTLGASGLRVSEIALGNWITHGSQVGGAAESVLGDILKGVRRSSYVLATKVFWPTGQGPNDRGLSRKHMIESCHASLRRLQTDYVDLYQAHRYDKKVRLEETMRAFEDLVRSGK